MFDYVLRPLMILVVNSSASELLAFLALFQTADKLFLTF